MRPDSGPTRLSVIGLIFRRELRDVARDRRTLFTMLVLPVLLYPALMVGFGRLVSGLSRQIEDEGFDVILTVDGAALDRDRVHPESFVARLFEEPRFRLQTGGDTRTDAVASGSADLSLDLPTSALAPLERVEPLTLTPVYRSSDDGSKAAYSALERLAATYRATLAPLTVVPDRDLSSPEQRGGQTFGGLLAMLVLFMALTGTFHPALDLAAGEKERGTLETLLLTPASRTELVLGKYLTVLVVAVLAALANLGSLALTFQSFSGVLAKAAGQGGVRVTLSPSTFFVILAGLTALSGVFAAVSLALSAFARSYKEGQAYLTPVFLVVLPLGMVGLLPGVRLDQTFAFVPVANVALLMKARLMGETPHWETIAALGSSSVLAIVSLAWCRWQFQREDVLFREGAPLFQFRRSVPSKPRPAAPPASVALGLLMIVGCIFAIGTWLDGRPFVQYSCLMGALALVPLLLARTTSDSVTTALGWRRIPVSIALAAVILGMGALAVSLGIGSLQERWLGPPDPLLMDPVRPLMELPLLLRVTLLAAIPALAEEILFRGLVLRGLVTTFGRKGAVVLTAVLFAGFHLSVHRFFPQLALGTALGWLALSTRSLWPAVLAHAAHNATLVLMADAAPSHPSVWIALIVLMGPMSLLLTFRRLRVLEKRDPPA